MRNLMETNQKMALPPAVITYYNTTKGFMQILETSKGRLIQIELLVLFTSFLLLFLVTSGSCRRRCNNYKFRLVIFMAYVLSTYVLTYALGLMHEAPFRNELFPVWAMFLMIALGSADSISAYSLEDNEQWKSYNWQIGIKLIWLGLLMGLYITDTSNTMISVECLFFVLGLKADERARAFMAASQHSLERNSKVVADYMSEIHKNQDISRAETDPVSLRGYKYLVRGEEERWVNNIVLVKRLMKSCVGKEQEPAAPPYYRTPWKDAEIITVEKVWECKGRLLRPGRGNRHNKIKDLCLSFALFKLLRLRYAGYSLPKEAHEKTWNLICHGLLSEKEGYKRAFRVVEVELSFLFDFFYTKYNVIFQPGRMLLKLLELVYVVIGIRYTISILKNYKTHSNNYQLATLPNGLSIDVLMTSVMIISFITVELMQFFLMFFSEWAKVMWICKYVQKNSWQGNVWIESMIKVICWVRLLKPWEQKLRQYSLLESYSYKPCRLWNNELMAVYIDQTRDGQKKSKPIKLTDQVKEAVFDALKSINYPKLKIGETLRRGNNVAPTLSWPCPLETQTQDILVWHIATSFCELEKPVISNSPEQENFLLATSLSKYLAYLVAFAPRLLPDHPYVVEYVFDQVIMEARKFFKECKTMEERVNKIKEGGSSENDETVIQRGARLGNHLVNVINDEETIWKILADFWVELMLFVAPSDNARAHAEHLTRGGEFVTHLWALLSHAGIKRGDPSVSSQEETVDQGQQQ